MEKLQADFIHGNRRNASRNANLLSRVVVSLGIAMNSDLFIEWSRKDLFSKKTNSEQARRSIAKFRTARLGVASVAEVGTRDSH